MLSGPIPRSGLRSTTTTLSGWQPGFSAPELATLNATNLVMRKEEMLAPVEALTARS